MSSIRFAISILFHEPSFAARQVLNPYLSRFLLSIVGDDVRSLGLSASPALSEILASPPPASNFLLIERPDKPVPGCRRQTHPPELIAPQRRLR
jgi:hypothetical protein